MTACRVAKPSVSLPWRMSPLSQGSAIWISSGARARRQSAMIRIFASRLGVAATAADARTTSASRVTPHASHAGFGGQALQEGEHGVQPVAQLTAVDDHVDRALLQQELGALKAFGQLLPHGLLDDARSGEADQGLGLGNHRVAEH